MPGLNVFPGTARLLQRRPQASGLVSLPQDIGRALEKAQPRVAIAVRKPGIDGPVVPIRSVVRCELMMARIEPEGVSAT